MPTHFSKLEGSPSNMQRERRRRRRELAVSTKLPPAVGFDESVGSTVTACEGNIRNNNHMNMNRIHNNSNSNKRNNNFGVGNSFRRAPSAVGIPQFINVENSKRLQQGQRPPQHDAYCQSRVSVIGSLPSHGNDAGSSNVSSLSSPRSRGTTNEAEDRYGFPPSRERRRLPTLPLRQKPSSPRRTLEAAKKSGKYQADTYTLTRTSASGDRHRSRSPTPPKMHPLVNAHGVFGSESNQKSNRKTNHRSKDNRRRRKSHTTDPLVSSRRRKAQTALESVRHLEDSIAEAYGNPYSRGAPSNSRRRTNPKVIDHDGENDSFDESRNDATLMGERFADDSSEFEEVRIGNDRSNSSHQQMHHHHHHHHHHQQCAATKWLCDVCKEARFDTYVEAYRHEKECRKRQNKTLERSRTKESKEFQYNRGDKDAKIESNSGRNGIHDFFYNNNNNNGHQYREQHLRNQLQEMSLSSSSGSQPSSHGTFATTPIASKRVVYNNYNNKNDSKEATRWLCSVCKEVSFDHYQDACYHEKICRIRMEATADLRGETAETTGSAASVPPLHFDLTQYYDGNRYNPETNNNPPEGRQDESTRPTTTAQTQYTNIGAIERERGGDLHPSSVGRAYNEKNNIVRQQDFEFLAGEIQTRNPKGEAYDRYVSLASQQEEEEERERLIALAKQTREEELMSFRQEDDDEERYVCLA